jgi:hypothetical protein
MCYSLINLINSVRWYDLIQFVAIKIHPLMNLYIFLVKRAH